MSAQVVPVERHRVTPRSEDEVGVSPRDLQFDGAVADGRGAGIRGQILGCRVVAHHVVGCHVTVARRCGFGFSNLLCRRRWRFGWRQWGRWRFGRRCCGCLGSCFCGRFGLRCRS